MRSPRVHLVQEQLNLQSELASRDAPSTSEPLEDAIRDVRPGATASARVSRTRRGGPPASIQRSCAGPVSPAPGARTRRPPRFRIARRQPEQGAEQHAGRPPNRASGSLARSGMGHQADHVAACVAYAGDVVHRSVGVVDVAKHDATLAAQLGQGDGVADVVALEVVDRDAQPVPAGTPEVRTLRSLPTSQFDGVHKKVRPRFFCSAPGNRWASVSTWKPLQMPTTGPPPAAKLHRRHDRREAGDGPRAQVVAVGEAAGEDHGIEADQVASPCQTMDASAPSASTASTTSCSQLEPGNSTTPTRAVTGAGSRVTGGILDHRVGEQSPAQFVDLRPGRPLVGGVDARNGTPCRPAPRNPARNPSAGKARSMVAPCGSAMPGRSDTSTSTGTRVTRPAPAPRPVGEATSPVSRS